MIAYLLAGLAGYLLGSLNFAALVGRIKKINFREVGTGNFGTMNVFRATQSILWAGLTLLWDAGKGIASMLIGYAASSMLGADPELGKVVAGLAAIAGHNHSFLLEFKSGRGVATFLGTSVIVNPLITISWLLSWIPGYLVTGIMSVGQILASIYMPAFSLFLSRSPYELAYAFGAGLLMLEAHLEKIKAIRSGEEPRNYWNLKSKKKVSYN